MWILEYSALYKEEAIAAHLHEMRRLIGHDILTRPQAFLY